MAILFWKVVMLLTLDIASLFNLRLHVGANEYSTKKLTLITSTSDKYRKLISTQPPSSFCCCCCVLVISWRTIWRIEKCGFGQVLWLITQCVNCFWSFQILVKCLIYYGTFEEGCLQKRFTELLLPILKSRSGGVMWGGEGRRVIFWSYSCLFCSHEFSWPEL